LASIVSLTDPRPTGRLIICLFAIPLCVSAQKFYTYVGDIGPDHVLLAWGTTAGDNTIGRSSRSHGRATVRIGDQNLTVTDHNYVMVRNLRPDTEYEYVVSLGGRRIGQARIRTWPLKSEKLRFFVIGDFGSGDSAQKSIAAAMWAEFQKNWSDNPVRFVITTGDNLYGTLGFTLRFRDTGDEDDEWESKFFAPNEQLVARVPFYPSLGNHDGNETESRADLLTYLDNFFFPGNTPGRYYRFSFGGLADFFALDSTENSEEGSPRPVYLEGSEQHRWLEKNLSESRVPWKIPYFHHPPFNAGPRHPAVARELKHFLDLFKANGVKVVFTGHEHNFQFSQKNGETDDIRYVVSGAGGELRRGNVQSEMPAAQIEGWAPSLHFLLVEIEGKEMRITPKSSGALTVMDRSGRPIPMPLPISAP
jgi:tartrate-resistant acid phosphatase type 5